MTGHKIPFSFRTIPHQRRGSVDNLGMFAKRQSTSECNLYTNPTAGAVLKAEDTLKISWDTNCYTPAGNSIRITLHTAKEGQMRKGWSEVNWGLGSFETKFDPAWIGSQANVPVFLAINDNNAPPWMSLIEQGPTFNVTYDAVAAVSAGLAAGSSTSLPSSETYTPWESVNNFFKQGMNKGQIAAAVIMPILAVGAFLAVYILWSRRKEAEKRKEWKEKMDQRMSTISVDWKSMSAAGGHAAVRQSMAISMAERRASSFYGQQNSSFQDFATPRPRMNSEATSSAHRVSRVSFAADNRPSLAMDRIPAVPRLPAAYQQTGRKSVLERDTIYDNSPPNGSLSPIQQAGAFVLDDDSIRDRLSAASANKDHARPSMDEDLNRDLSYEPAIAMMRDQAPRLADPVPTSPITPLAPALTREPANGSFRTYSIGAYSGTSASDSFFDTVTPTAPSTLAATSSTTAPESPVDPDEALRAYAARAANSNQPQSTASPFSGFANGPGLAAATGLDMSSPDAMFRAYAASRPSAPQPAQVNTTGNAMRQLYGNGGMTQGLVGAGRSRGDTITGDRNPYRDSMADGGVGRAN